MITNEQELLDAYVTQCLTVIGEYSGDFAADWSALISEVEKYASLRGLSTACLDETRADLHACARWRDE